MNAESDVSVSASLVIDWHVLVRTLVQTPISFFMPSQPCDPQAEPMSLQGADASSCARTANLLSGVDVELRN